MNYSLFSIYSCVPESEVSLELDVEESSESDELLELADNRLAAPEAVVFLPEIKRKKNLKQYSINFLNLSSFDRMYEKEK